MTKGAPKVVTAAPILPTPNQPKAVPCTSRGYNLDTSSKTPAKTPPAQPTPTAENTTTPDRNSTIVSDMPYQVNKSRLLENMASLIHEKTVEGITDLRDESDKDGMRIVIEVRKGEEPEVILNLLYKHTQLQDTQSIIMLALVNNMPKVLSLREMVYYFIEHRAVVIERRTRYDLEQAEACKSFVVEGDGLKYSSDVLFLKDDNQVLLHLKSPVAHQNVYLPKLRFAFPFVGPSFLRSHLTIS